MFLAMAGGTAAPRRYEALAFIIERLVRSGSAPTYEEIGERLSVSKARAQQLVDQLIVDKIIEKVPGTQRALRVRDVSRSREIVDEFARSLGWSVAAPLGVLQEPHRARPLPHVKLPELPPFEDLPELD